MKKEHALESINKKLVVGVESGFDPREYFKDRKGLWVSGYFGEKILPEATVVEKGGEFDLSLFKLLRYSTDKEIEAELPKKHLFTPTEVCSSIASMIDKQPKGEGEDLLADGNWNLFYTSAFVVRVRWGAGLGVWRVYCWHRDGDGWGAGYRVFSPAN